MEEGREEHEENLHQAQNQNASETETISCSTTVKSFKTLKDSPRELWIVYLLKFFSSYSYFSFSLVLTLFLTEEYNFTDEAAGWIYGAYGLMSTLFGLLCGWVIDYLGVRSSLLSGSIIGSISRFILATSSNKTMAKIVLFSALPFAESFGIPILTIGIKRYSNTETKAMAYSLFYSIMNVAALIAGPAVDFFRLLFKDGLTIFGHHLSALRLVLLSSFISTFCMVLISLVSIREIDLDENGEIREYKPHRENPLLETKQVLHSPRFWRLVLFTLLLLGVRMVFRHLDATLPKYMTREFSPDAPFGLIYAINPAIIIVLVPIIGALTRHLDTFKMIVFGSFIAGASPFWLVCGNHYWDVVLFMITLSLGEAIYSPKVYEYSLNLSEDGKEGLFSALASAPLFTVKFLVGGMSGWLLAKYCPEQGPRNSSLMWAIVGIMSFSSPVLMTIFSNVIQPKKSNQDRSEYTPVYIAATE